MLRYHHGLECHTNSLHSYLQGQRHRMVNNDCIFLPSSGHLQHDITSSRCVFIGVLVFAFVMAASVVSLTICVCPVPNIFDDHHGVRNGWMRTASCQIFYSVQPTTVVRENHCFCDAA